MAISFAEPRIAPLVETDYAWKPFGLFEGLPPAFEMLREEYTDDAVPKRGGKLQRSHSWSGYPNIRMARAYSGETKELGSNTVVECEASPAATGKIGVRSLPCSSTESPCSTTATLSPGKASWAALTEEEEEEEESKLFDLELAHEFDYSTSASASSATQGPNTGFFMDRIAEERNTTVPSSAGSARAIANGRANRAPQGVTTYMVQNILRTLTRRGFMDTLDDLGFVGTYNFVHLPKTFGTGRNKGFAFVNFTKLADAERFARRFAPVDVSEDNSRVWRVAPADVQGFRANAASANSRKMNRVRNNSCRPLIFGTNTQETQPLP